MNRTGANSPRKYSASTTRSLVGHDPSFQDDGEISMRVANASIPLPLGLNESLRPRMDTLWLRLESAEDFSTQRQPGSHPTRSALALLALTVLIEGHL